MSANQAADPPEGAAPAPPKPLTLTIIRAATRAADETALLATRVLRLDWLGLTSLGDALDLFDGLRELYLQHNRLTDVSGLELLQELELLTLGGNAIRELDLGGLASLRALDAHDNLIADIAPGALPKGLAICDLRDNPCASTQGYRDRVQTLLPNCACLDGVDIEPEDEAEEEKVGDAEDETPGGSASSEGKHSDELTPGASEERARPGLVSAPPASGASSGGAGGTGGSDAATAAAVDSALESFRRRREAVTSAFHARVTEERAQADALAAAALASSEAQLVEATQRLSAAREAVSLHSRERAAALSATAGGLEQAASALAGGGGASESKGPG